MPSPLTDSAEKGLTPSRSIASEKEPWTSFVSAPIFSAGGFFSSGGVETVNPLRSLRGLLLNSLFCRPGFFCFLLIFQKALSANDLLTPTGHHFSLLFDDGPLFFQMKLVPGIPEPLHLHLLPGLQQLDVILQAVIIGSLFQTFL